MMHQIEYHKQDRNKVLQSHKGAGFTLVELLVVVTIIGVIGTATVVFLNPEELFKQGRDSSRLSDMSTITRAISIYLTQVTVPDLNGGANDGDCANTQYVYGEIANNSFKNGVPPNPQRVLTQKPLNPPVNGRKVDGTGWIPIDFTKTLEGQSPIATLPVDPQNDNNPNTISDARYRYACTTVGQYEINAQLESTKYKTTLDKDGKDGGDNLDFYEVGNNLNL